MKDRWIVAAGLAGFAGVALGAAAAHLARGDAQATAWLETASRFLLAHAAALGVVGALERSGRSPLLTAAGALFAAGAACFAGGLTLLALTGSPAGLWSTPVGGTLLLAGWLALAGAGLRRGG